MIKRITISQLETLIARINEATNSPATQYNKIDGKLVANIGNYHLYQAYGGYALHRMDNAGGGINDIFGGCGTARDMYNKMQSFLFGLEYNNS